MSQARSILERLERDQERRQKFNAAHPPITRVTVARADAARTLTDIGDRGVTCNLTCYGNNIPVQYNHAVTVDLLRRGIDLNGGESYFGLACTASPTRRICVRGNRELRQILGPK